MTTLYDSVPYPLLSYSQTHPDRLAVLAGLMGMQPAPVERCRVLELGCAGGGNVIPMACALPGSQFVGVDLSAKQIEQGQAIVSALGLKNVSLRHRDILDVDDSIGQFDYIITHGIYSWVPDAVRGKILDISRRCLAPQGVAYVSYNAYPGWHSYSIVRDLMLFHTRGISDARERAAEGRAAIQFLTDSLETIESPFAVFLKSYATFLREQKDRISPDSDALLLHDELEEVNEPVYFYQFAERAARHGLQYLSEAELSAVMMSNFPPAVMDRLRQMSRDLIELEQYMDFARHRMFRQTLLVRDDVSISRLLKPDRLFDLCVSSSAKPVSAHPDCRSKSVEVFRSADDARLSTDHPVSKAAMLYLGAMWPQAVPFRRLLAYARQQAPGDADPARDAQALAANLLQSYGYSSRLVELRPRAPAFAVQAGPKPVASPFARIQAQSMNRVTNLCHERVALSDLGRFLIRQLDGSADRAALQEKVLKLMEDGRVTLRADGLGQAAPARSPGELRSTLADEIDQELDWMARAALLVGSA